MSSGGGDEALQTSDHPQNGDHAVRVNGRQRSLLAGFFSNIAVVLVGFGLADQPLLTLPVTWGLRAGMMGSGAVMMMLALWVERGRSRHV